jgi:hypothetical protein
MATMKGIPILHDEVKTKTTGVLTPRAWYIRGISARELVEEWRGRLKSPTANPHV